VERYKFTEKERDTETEYDYFGARYYDSRIGRWLSVDLQADKTLYLTPYHYTRNNPINIINPNGEEDFTATVRTYIPYQRVGPYWENNRGPILKGSSYRTEQKIMNVS
jgi:RHS repeat-associated protein